MKQKNRVIKKLLKHFKKEKTELTIMNLNCCEKWVDKNKCDLREIDHLMSGEVIKECEKNRFHSLNNDVVWIDLKKWDKWTEIKKEKETSFIHH